MTPRLRVGGSERPSGWSTDHRDGARTPPPPVGASERGRGGTCVGEALGADEHGLPRSRIWEYVDALNAADEVEKVLGGAHTPPVILRDEPDPC